MTSNIKNVNGPKNYYRLKKNDKDIYVFFDVHLDLTIQSKCNNNTENIDIDNLLEVYFTQNKNKMIDFLFETGKNNNNKNYSNNEKYIRQIHKMFLKLHNIEKNNENLKISKNLRLHYIDVRQNTFLSNIGDYYDDLHNFKSNNSISIILNMCSDMFVVCAFLYKHIASIKNTNNPEIEKIIEYALKNNTDSVNNELHKILEKITLVQYYNNKNVHEKINNFFEEYVFKKLNYLLVTLNSFYNILQPLNEKQLKDFYGYKEYVKIFGKNPCSKYIKFEYDSDEVSNKYSMMVEKTNKVISIFTDISCFIMDCYFLRRVLDKQYIKNVISYTGGLHSSLYVWFLIKYFDFEIVENQNGNKNEIIKNIKNNDYYDSLKIIINENNYQCIQLPQPFFN